MMPLAPHLTAFFEQHLPLERQRSEQTRDSYAYAFKLLLTYASARLKVSPSQLALEQIDAPLVRGFLNDLEATRRNGPSSRNARLAAIKSFMHYLEYRVPSAMEQIRQILAIPVKHAESRLVRHLTAEEMQAILDAPDPTVRAGVRDRAMLHLCYAAGLRVSELIGLRVDNLTRQPQASVLVLGKGRRERCLPLWKTTTTALRAWLAARGAARVPELFVTARGESFTRSGFEYLLGKHVRTATRRCPTLATKRVSPHVVRHYLRVDHPASDQGLAESLSLAGTRAPAHHRNLHSGGSIREARGARIGDASDPALGPLQGERPADRVPDVAPRYAE